MVVGVVFVALRRGERAAVVKGGRQVAGGSVRSRLYTPPTVQRPAVEERGTCLAVKQR